MNQDLRGKNALITGANTGIGKVTAEVLASRGARVVLACRSREKTEPVVAAIRAAGGDASLILLDLADLATVRAAAAEVLAPGEPLHLLLNNAGLAGARGTTKQGLEITFGTNHLGHFLLTKLLQPALVAAKGARVVNVASQAHRSVMAIDWAALERPAKGGVGLKEYGVSKLANILFTTELARRQEAAGSGVHAYALHPGVVASDIWRGLPGPLRGLAKLFMLSNEDGAKTSLYCATSAAAGAENGLYYDKSRVAKPSRLAENTALAGELWSRSEAWSERT
jgi:retinol dehydrogenase-12